MVRPKLSLMDEKIQDLNTLLGKLVRMPPDVCGLSLNHTSTSAQTVHTHVWRHRKRGGPPRRFMQIKRLAMGSLRTTLDNMVFREVWSVNSSRWSFPPSQRLSLQSPACRPSYLRTTGLCGITSRWWTLSDRMTSPSSIRSRSCIAGWPNNGSRKTAGTLRGKTCARPRSNGGIDVKIMPHNRPYHACWIGVAHQVHRVI
jgi:hypothetical protein